MIGNGDAGFGRGGVGKGLTRAPRRRPYLTTLRLLLCFAQDTTGTAPSALDWSDLDEPLIAAFLDHLETDRRNSARTRNLRLTVIRSLFRYAALRHPEHLAVIARVLSIPAKPFDRRAVTFLTSDEARALIDVAPQGRWEGRRDRAMLTLALHAGLRVSPNSSRSTAATSVSTRERTYSSRASVESNAPFRSPETPGRYSPLVRRTRRSAG